MGEYWKGIIAALGSGLELVLLYTDQWNNVWLPTLVAVLTAVGVVVKSNTKDGKNVLDK